MSQPFALPATPATDKVDFVDVRTKLLSGAFSLGNDITAAERAMIPQIIYSPATALEKFGDFSALNRKVTALAGGEMGLAVEVTEAVIVAQMSAAEEMDFSDFIDLIEYQGFNRTMTRVTAIKTLGGIACAQIGLVAALRGTNLTKIGAVMILVALKGGGTRLVSINQLVEEKVLEKSTKGMGSTALSVGRIATAFPMETALILWKKGYNVKRYDDCPLAPWLQFNAAMSLDLPGMHELSHVIQFKFAKALKKEFNKTLWNQIRSRKVSGSGAKWDHLVSGHLNNNPESTLAYGAQAPATPHNYWERFEMVHGSLFKKTFNFTVPALEAAQRMKAQRDAFLGGEDED